MLVRCFTTITGAAIGEHRNGSVSFVFLSHCFKRENGFYTRVEGYFYYVLILYRSHGR